MTTNEQIDKAAKNRNIQRMENLIYDAVNLWGTGLEIIGDFVHVQIEIDGTRALVQIDFYNGDCQAGLDNPIGSHDASALTTRLDQAMIEAESDAADWSHTMECLNYTPN